MSNQYPVGSVYNRRPSAAPGSGGGGRSGSATSYGAVRITIDTNEVTRTLARLSPKTQRTASMMLDLPHPLGPTTPTSCPGNKKLVASANDLKPDNLMELRRTVYLFFKRISKRNQAKPWVG